MVVRNSGPVILQEQKTVKAMIAIYCRKKHGCQSLCAQCADLEHYAVSRLTFCRFGEEKNTCELCPKHCYRRDYKEKIQKVMRFSGPRMLLYHPVMAIKHLLKNLKSNRRKYHD